MVVANLTLITYNIVKFLIPLKIKSWLLILYYVLAAILDIALIIELSFMILSYENCKGIKSMDLSIVEVIVIIANIAICCLIVIIMYQISISIRLIAGLMDEVVAKWRKKVLYSIIIGFFVICCTFIVVVLITKDDWHEQLIIWIAYIVIYTILSALYVATLIRLWTAMKHLI